MLTLWRICSKLVEYFDRTADRDRRSTREIPILLVVILGVLVVTAVAWYFSGGPIEGTDPIYGTP